MLVALRFICSSKLGFADRLLLRLRMVMIVIDIEPGKRHWRLALR